MADEITGSVSLTIQNGAFLDSIDKTFTIDQTTQGGGNPGTVDVGTTEETIAFGDVTPGMLLIVNLEADGGNYIEYGPDSTGMVVLGKVQPGGVHMLELGAGVVLKAKANTASVKCLIKAYNA